MSNFSGATAIAGASGSVAGTNVGATVEAGEPLEWTPFGPNQTPTYPTISPIATVWWKWTCPTSDSYFFNTADSSFPTMVQVFNYSGVYPSTTEHPVDFSLMTEVTYLQNQSAGFGGGFHYGAQVAFNGISGTDYYIRVDGRNGVTIGSPPVAVDPHGNIKLAWGEFNSERLGGCSGCPLDFQSGQCLGTVMLDASKDWIYSFGNFSGYAGLFKIRYCGGTFVMLARTGGTFCNTEQDFGARGLPNAVGAGFSTAGQLNLYHGVIPTSPPPPPTNPTGIDSWAVPGTLFPTPAAGSSDFNPGYGRDVSLENANLCLSTGLFCALGEIGLTYKPYWFRCSDTGVIKSFASNHSNNPSYQLIYNPLLISMLEPVVCYPVQTSGYGHYSLECYIKNLTNIDWPVTVILLNGGGVSNALGSAAVTLVANSTTGGSAGTITFDADPKNNLITATLQISICGIVVGTLTYPMYPIYAASLTSINSVELNCGSYGKFWESTLTLTQMNPLAFNNYENAFSIAMEAIIDAGGVLIQTNTNPRNCSGSIPDASMTVMNGFPIRSFSIPFGIQATSSQQSVTITAQMFNSGQASYPSWVALPSFSQTIAVPAA
jgi:hypothetical protein